MKQLSILVVSRTPELLSQLLASLDLAWSGTAESVEILCSWNGSSADEQKIQPGRLPFKIVQRLPYHFASNMNGLAGVATGDVLVFANDDLVADPGSLDCALQRLTADQGVGIVGAYLRTSDGELAHAGISFTPEGAPYHRLQYFADLDNPACKRESKVPAVTGAYMAIRRHDFLRLLFSEDVKVCGEDVLLCLECRRVLGRSVLYCPAVSGVHNAETTRKSVQGQGGRQDDMLAMQISYRNTRQRADRDELLAELVAAQEEADILRGLCRDAHGKQKQLLDLAEMNEELTRTISESQAIVTKLSLENAVWKGEIGRLAARVRQLEDQQRARA